MQEAGEAAGSQDPQGKQSGSRQGGSSSEDDAVRGSAGWRLPNPPEFRAVGVPSRQPGRLQVATSPSIPRPRRGAAPPRPVSAARNWLRSTSPGASATTVSTNVVPSRHRVRMRNRTSGGASGHQPGQSGLHLDQEGHAGGRSELGCSPASVRRKRRHLHRPRLDGRRRWPVCSLLLRRRPYYSRCPRTSPSRCCGVARRLGCSRLGPAGS